MIQERVQERAEVELSKLVEKRHDPSDGEEMREELWAESVMRYHMRAAAERRQEWIAFHSNMCELHTRLADEHASKAEALESLEGAQ